MKAAPAPKLAETDLGEPVQAWLEAEGWTVYREVKYRDPSTGSIWIADLVITRAGEVGVVELKTSLGIAVMAQAYRWRRLAHVTYVAAPAEKKRAIDAPSPTRRHGLDILAGHGIGVLVVRQVSKAEQLAAMRPGAEPPGLVALVAVAVEPGEPRDVTGDALVAALHEEQKSFSAAGTKNGRRWSPREKAFKAIRELLEERGGAAPIEDAARAAGFSPRVVTDWAKKKRIEGVRLDARTVVVMLQRVAPGQEAPITSDRMMKSEWRRFA